MASRKPAWFVPQADTLEWREWDGDFVVFHAASGNTHFLNALAGIVLQTLERGPITIDELLESIERDAGLSLDDEVESNIRGLVKRLDALGLIEPVRS